MEIGMQLYSMREYCKTESDLKQTLKKVSEIGYKTVQISGVYDIDFALLRSLCDEYGLRAVGTHTSPDEILKNTDHVISQHKALDCDNIGIGGMPISYRDRADGVKDFVKDFAPAWKKINDAGLNFTYHNHAFEFEKFDGETAFDTLLKLSAPYNMKYVFDVYWAQAGGVNPVDFIYKLKGRMDICHYKDMALKGQEQRYAAIGDGNLDWDKIIKASKETGVKYAVVEQDLSYGKDIFDEAKRSYDFLNGKF